MVKGNSYRGTGTTDKPHTATSGNTCHVPKAQSNYDDEQAVVTELDSRIRGCGASAPDPGLLLVLRSRWWPFRGVVED